MINNKKIKTNVKKIGEEKNFFFKEKKEKTKIFTNFLEISSKIIDFRETQKVNPKVFVKNFSKDFIKNVFDMKNLRNSLIQNINDNLLKQNENSLQMQENLEIQLKNLTNGLASNYKKRSFLLKNLNNTKKKEENLIKSYKSFKTKIESIEKFLDGLKLQNTNEKTKKLIDLMKKALKNEKFEDFENFNEEIQNLNQYKFKKSSTDITIEKLKNITKNSIFSLKKGVSEIFY